MSDEVVPPDEAIAAAVQDGDAEQFGLLAERYEAKITRYARKFLFNHDDAQDMVQEVFVKAYKNIQSFDTKQKFSPWVFRIAHNEFINAIKKKGREPLPFFDPDALFPHPIAPESTDREALERELKATLDECLAELSPKYREPLVLFFYEEMSYQEIAEVLRIPVSTVGVRINRAKTLLRHVYPPRKN